MPKSECLWLELSRLNSTEKIIVGTIYRHPIQSSLRNFLGSFSDCLNDLSILQKIYYILGDFIINIQKFKRTFAAYDFINLEAIPIITKPTRLTPDSTSIMDHIITNDSNYQINSFIFEVDVADHDPILCKIDKRKSNLSKNFTMYFIEINQNLQQKTSVKTREKSLLLLP